MKLTLFLVLFFAIAAFSFRIKTQEDFEVPPAVEEKADEIKAKIAEISPEVAAAGAALESQAQDALEAAGPALEKAKEALGPLIDAKLAPFQGQLDDLKAMIEELQPKVEAALALYTDGDAGDAGDGE